MSVLANIAVCMFLLILTSCFLMTYEDFIKITKKEIVKVRKKKKKKNQNKTIILRHKGSYLYCTYKLRLRTLQRNLTFSATRTWSFTHG